MSLQQVSDKGSVSLAYGSLWSGGKWQPEYDADYILGHDENGIVSRFLRNSIVPHRWAGDTVFPTSGEVGSTLHTGRVFPMLTQSDKEAFNEILDNKTSGSGVFWDGNGLAYPYRTGFSAHIPTSVACRICG